MHHSCLAPALALALLPAALTLVGPADAAAASPTRRQAAPPSTTPAADPLAVRWNAALLDAIKEAKPSPPVVSRMLAVAHTCMYDTWSAFDRRATGVHFNLRGEQRRPPDQRSEPAKTLAVSHAAHRCALDLLPKGRSGFDSLLAEFDPAPQATESWQSDARQLGQAAAEAVLAARADDGANDKGQIPCQPASTVKAYCDYTGYAPVNAGNTPIDRVDPNRWQPLPNGAAAQVPLAPHWGRVRPFSFDSADAFLRAFPIPADRLPKLHGSADYRAQVETALRESRRLGAERHGNRKAIVEFWADGPFSYLPPGHFGELAHFVVRRDRLSLDASVKLFFVLHNASFDAGIVIWHLKYVHDYVRPITAVRHVMRGRTVLAWGGPDTPWDERPHPVTGQPWGYNRELPGEEWLPYNPDEQPEPPAHAGLSRIRVGAQRVQCRQRTSAQDGDRLVPLRLRSDLRPLCRRVAAHPRRSTGTHRRAPLALPQLRVRGEPGRLVAPLWRHPFRGRGCGRPVAGQAHRAPGLGEGTLLLRGRRCQPALPCPAALPDT